MLDGRYAVGGWAAIAVTLVNDGEPTEGYLAAETRSGVMRRFVNLDEGENTDLQAIENGYVSVTPIHYDLTAYEYLEQLKTWSWESSKDEASGSPKDEVRSAK